MKDDFEAFFLDFADAARRVETTDRDQRVLTAGAAVRLASERVALVRATNSKLMFIGNGGSAAIASHLAIDYLRNGRCASHALVDGATLTCLANDYSFEEIFQRQLAIHGRKGDLLVALSSSGSSENILRAISAARVREMAILTMSGFEPKNSLRMLGDLNFYVPSHRYGIVEGIHLAIGHLLLETLYLT